MPIDPNIILGLKSSVQVQPQNQDPVERAGKSIAFQNLMRQSQDEEAQRSALVESGGDNERYRALLAGRGQHRAVEALDKATLERRAKDAEIKKNDAAAGKSSTEDAMKKLEHGAAILDTVKDQSSYDMALRVGQITGTFPKEAVANFPKEYTPQFVESLKQAGLTRAQQLTAQNQAGTLAQTVVRDTNTNARGVEANLIADNRQQVQAAAARAETNLTPDALEAAASRYAIDGTLPPNLGRGAQGAANSALILNRAAAMAKEQGNTAEEARLRQIAGRASTSALTQLSKQEAMVGAFERNFIRNADLAVQQSEKVDRLGSPAIDRWLLAGRKNVAGDPEVAKLDVAMKAVINEYTKIVSGSMGNAAMAEGEIKKVTDLLNSAKSKEQVREVIGFMKQETQNRMHGFAEQKAEISSGMRGGSPQVPAPTSPSPTPAAAPAAPVTATGPNGEKLVLKDGQWQPAK